MKRMRLTREERAIERDIGKGLYRPVSPEKFKEIAAAIARRRKEAVLSLRINQGVLDSLKRKAKALKVPYQTLISEILQRYAA